MSWNIFRKSHLKTLDKIYLAYNTIHGQFVERMATTNELFLAHAEQLRSELWTLGAAFDIVIAEEGPKVLAEAEKEYGFIPFTSLSSTDYSFASELIKKNTDKAYSMWKGMHSSSGKTKLTNLMKANYKLKFLSEVGTKHLEVLNEAKSIGLIKKDTDILGMHYSDLNKLEAMYLFPKGKKGITDAPEPPKVRTFSY